MQDIDKCVDSCILLAENKKRRCPMKTLTIIVLCVTLFLGGCGFGRYSQISPDGKTKVEWTGFSPPPSVGRTTAYAQTAYVQPQTVYVAPTPAYYAPCYLGYPLGIRVNIGSRRHW